MEWIGLVLAAIVSVVGGIITLLIGRRIDKAHGIPNDLESKLIAEMREYQEALERNNERLEGEVEERKRAETTCLERLTQSETRERSILRRLDDAEITITRLRVRLGEAPG